MTTLRPQPPPIPPPPPLPIPSSPPLRYIQSTSQPPDCVPDEECIILMEGCMFLDKVFVKYKKFQKLTPANSEKYAQTQTMEQMAFYLFHFLMEKDPHSQKTTDGSVHPYSTSKRLNLKSAVLAALMLASKFMDSQIPMRHLLTYSANVSNDHSQQFWKGESGSPCQGLVHLYENHLLILNGYDFKISCLPYTSVKEVSELLFLSAKETDRFKRVFDEFGVKFSPSNLIDEPLLIAFAVFHFGYYHLHCLNWPISFDTVLGEDEKRMVEILSDQMSAINALYLENVPSTEEIEDKTTQMRETPNLVISLSSIMDQLGQQSKRIQSLQKIFSARERYLKRKSERESAENDAKRIQSLQKIFSSARERYPSSNLNIVDMSKKNPQQEKEEDGGNNSVTSASSSKEKRRKRRKRKSKRKRSDSEKTRKEIPTDPTEQFLRCKALRDFRKELEKILLESKR